MGNAQSDPVKNRVDSVGKRKGYVVHRYVGVALKRRARYLKLATFRLFELGECLQHQ